MAAIPTLTTERLRLRPFRADDWQAYAAMCGDAETMLYIGEGKPVSATDCWRNMAWMLGHWALHGFGQWAVERRSDGLLLGRCGANHPPDWPGFEVGWLVARDHWGQGYATEAARAALRYAFDVIGRDEVLHLIRPANLRSITVARKLGAAERETIDFRGAPVLLYVSSAP
jgi:RimJ/RimL family protein N-acetyltransferase